VVVGISTMVVVVGTVVEVVVLVVVEVVVVVELVVVVGGQSGISITFPVSLHLSSTMLNWQLSGEQK
jgi:hypothetical protein